MLVLENHRHDKPPLGFIEFLNDRLLVRFNEPITKLQFFSAFGSCGAKFTVCDFEENDEVCRIKEAEIYEFSLVANGRL